MFSPSQNAHQHHFRQAQTPTTVTLVCARVISVRTRVHRCETARAATRPGVAATPTKRRIHIHFKVKIC